MSDSWVRLDNASNIFLAARTDTDTKVFRLSAELDHDVESEVLQRALDATFDRYPLYRAVLRRGVFWYYLQDSDLRPRATPDTRYPCAPIYQPDRRTLLFRVMWHRQRIILEVFHVLSDGTGALWFLNDLVTEYVRLRFDAASAGTDSSEQHRLAASGDSARGLTTDSFAQYFRRRRQKASPEPSAFSEAARITPLPTSEMPPDQHRSSSDGTGADLGDDADPEPPSEPVERSRARVRVHRARGTRTPDHRPRAVELTLPTAPVLALARAEGVAMTMYLTSVFLASVADAAGDLGTAPTLAASVPVNLRQFFPSTSARNFFATVRVTHTFGAGHDDVGSISRHLERDFRALATPDQLETKVRRFIRLERAPVARIVPRPLKDVVLGLLNRVENRGLTVAVSNLGRVTLPADVDPHVRRIFLQVSAVRPQFCSVSHGDQLTITFTSPFIDTGHIREFARFFTARGIPVTAASTRVTEAELDQVPT